MVALGASPVAIISALPALSALFVLPTYPTLIAAVALDQTGSTRIGHAVFNHPFFIPGVVTVVSSVCLSSLQITFSFEYVMIKRLLAVE